MNKMFNVVKRARSAVVAVPLAVGAFAARAADALDVSPLVTDISAQKTNVGTIGMAILGIIVAIACFMWIRRCIK